jgi:hypothetical protein
MFILPLIFFAGKTVRRFSLIGSNIFFINKTAKKRLPDLPTYFLYPRNNNTED